MAASFSGTGELRRFLARAAPGYPPPRDGIAPGRQAILVATGARSAGGYRIAVLGVREERGRVVVSVREVTPGAGARSAALTFPYRLIEIAATGKRVEVEWKGRP